MKFARLSGRFRDGRRWNFLRRVSRGNDIDIFDSIGFRVGSEVLAFKICLYHPSFLSKNEYHLKLHIFTQNP